MQASRKTWFNYKVVWSTLHQTKVTLHCTVTVKYSFSAVAGINMVEMRSSIIMLIGTVFVSHCIPCREQYFTQKDFEVGKSYHYRRVQVPKVKTIWFQPAELSEISERREKSPVNSIRRSSLLEISDFKKRRNSKTKDVSSDRQAGFV